MSKKAKTKKFVANDSQKSNRIQLIPQTEKQKEYLDSLIKDEQVFAIGPAGTGKTYLPTLLALRMYLRKEIDRIVITRPAVSVGGEAHGFLPGTELEKLGPWVAPITELIEDYVGKVQLEQMLKNGDLTVSPFTYMRGKTFHNAFVILDEAQNTTKGQMETLLTRIGEGTRLVVCGDLRQSDKREANGLKVAVDLIRSHDIGANIVEFTSDDVVRSGICQRWVKAFESTG